MNVNDNKSSNDILNNIIHQWRQPLSQINSNIFAIDNILDELKIKDIRIEERLAEIEVLTKYMSQTIDDFKNSEKKEKLFEIKDIIYEAKEILKAYTSKHNISMNIIIEENFNYYGNRRELLQVVIVILNNAVEALLERNVFEKKIEIITSSDDTLHVISIVDNAGGMTEKVKEKIFDYDYTTKHSSEGSGIGLGMAKKIILENFKGDLSVRNLNHGSCFEIKLNL